jgi:hypothetical protein
MAGKKIIFFMFLLIFLISLILGFSLSKNNIWSSGLEGIGGGSLAFGDVNNDGRLDLILSGIIIASTQKFMLIMEQI